MPHFAEINTQTNEVLRVILAKSKLWCEYELDGTWVKTYKNTEGKNYAGIGFTYHPDKENLTAYALYSMGPVSVGYQGYYLDDGSTDGVTQANGSAADYSGAAYSVAFNVNDDLSVGYQVVDETQEALAGTLEADREITSITAAYSTGGMTVSVQQTDTDNRGFAVAGSEINVENLQVTLSFAF